MSANNKEHVFTYLMKKIPVKEGAAFFAFIEAREVSTKTNYEKLNLSFEEAFRRDIDNFVTLTDAQKKTLAQLDDKSKAHLSTGLSHQKAKGLTLDDVGAILQSEPSSQVTPQSNIAPPHKNDVTLSSQGEGEVRHIDGHDALDDD